MNNTKKNVPKLRFPEFTDDWEQRKFSDTFSTLQNNTLSRAELSQEEGYALNVHYGDILIKYDEILDVSAATLPFIPNADLVSKFKSSTLEDGDIIMADTAEDSTVGKCSEMLNLQGKPAISGLHTIPCRPVIKFAPGYLGYYMNSGSYHDQLLPLMQGIKVTSISKSALQDTVLSWPTSVDEQTKIGQYFMNLDNLITLHQRKLEQIKEYKKGMLQKMFPKDGEKVPEIRFPGFTEDWEQRKLGELGEITTGSTPSTSNSAYYSENGIPWVTPTDINALTISDTPRKLSDEGAKVGRVVPADTILCTCIASIGKNTLLTVKGSFNQQINSLTPYDENDAYFLLTESEMWSNIMKRMAASGTMQIVNKTEFSELKSMVPTLSEQQAIGSFFRNLDNLITLHQRKLDDMKEYKKGLLQQMFV